MKKELSFKKIDEIPEISQTFISLEGEGNNAGEPSLYIRVAGCYSAACTFCDTKFSWFKGSFPKILDGNRLGEWVKIYDNILLEEKNGINRLTITGGEPLHYLTFFDKDLEKVILKLRKKGFNINWLGIESNGNILKDKDNVTQLIKIFKKLKKININPQITISPKINVNSCYNNELKQDYVLDFYKSVFTYLENYFTFPVNYKFVWNISDTDNKLALDLIDTLKKLGIKNNKIFLMPFTPVDPNGKDKEEWEESKKITAKKALELGVRYSPRLHVDLNLD